MAPVLLAVVAADAVVSCRKGCEDVFLCVAYVLVVDVQCAALVAHGCLFAAGDAFDFDFHNWRLTVSGERLADERLAVSG